MFCKYIYLIISQKRLVIADHEIIDEDYKELLNTNGPDLSIINNSCKIFCFGYILGSRNGGVVNTLKEFS